jgi:hypothetical protein
MFEKVIMLWRAVQECFKFYSVYCNVFDLKSQNKAAYAYVPNGGAFRSQFYLF